MKKINQQIVEKLSKMAPEQAVTIYVPMHVSAAPPHMTANQTRLKNLSRKAIENLKSRRENDLAAFIKSKTDSMQEDLSFFKGEAPGIMICACQGFFEAYCLPVNTEGYVSIDKQFYLAPMIGLISDAQDFYVLELAEHEPKLLIGDMYGLSPTNIQLPTSIREVIGSDREERMPGKDYGLTKGYPDRFFKIIDNIIFDSTNHDLPLIIAGTETETAAYKHLSCYPKLISRSLTNSYDRSRMEELYQKTKAIIEEELIKPRHQSVIDEYLRLEQSDPAKTARNEQTMIQAAEAGRVDKLITTMSRDTTDNVQDSISRATTCITFLEPKLNSLMNKLALSVWQMKGIVLNLRPNEMPSTEPVVAKLRY